MNFEVPQRKARRRQKDVVDHKIATAPPVYEDRDYDNLTKMHELRNQAKQIALEPQKAKKIQVQPEPFVKKKPKRKRLRVNKSEVISKITLEEAHVSTYTLKEEDGFIRLNFD